MMEYQYAWVPAKSSGQIVSPWYGEIEEENDLEFITQEILELGKCTWTFKAPENYKIKIRFEYFQLKEG